MTKKKDYIAVSDTDLIKQGKQIGDYLQTNLAAMNLSDADAASFAAALQNFENGVGEHLAAKRTAQAARFNKRDARIAFVKEFRALVRQLRVRGEANRAHIVAVGLRVRDAVLTPLDAPEGVPHVIVGTFVALSHVLQIRDAETMRRAKPEGVIGCEIWIKYGGEATIEPSDYRFAGIATRSTYTVEHPAEHVGEVAHYLFRWINRRGMRGNWSNMGATITGAGGRRG